jgi:hypothetical protein
VFYIVFILLAYIGPLVTLFFSDLIYNIILNMISKPKVMRSNSPFRLNISCVGLHLLKMSLSPHMRESVELMIKLLNLHLSIGLSF